MKQFILIVVFCISVCPIHAQWTPVNCPDTSKAFQQIISDDGRLYSCSGISVYQSDNDGMSWLKMTTPLPVVNHIAFFKGCR